MEIMILSFAILVVAYLMLLHNYYKIEKRFKKLKRRCEASEAQKEFYKELAQKGIANISIDDVRKKSIDKRR